MGVKLTSARYSTVDVNENKLIDVLDGTIDSDGVNFGQLDAVDTKAENNKTAIENNDTDITNLQTQTARIPTSNVWQAGLRNDYTFAQEVRDWESIIQDRITTDTLEHTTSATAYDFDFDVFERPMGEDDTTYFARFSVTPISGVDIILVTDVQRNTPTTGTTRITINNPLTVDYTFTYPPTNFEDEIGRSVRQYVRNAEPAIDGVDVERPRDATYTLNPVFNAEFSTYWARRYFNGIRWRPAQRYIAGDEVEYINGDGVPRHVICEANHLSTAATNPDVASAVLHQPDADFTEDSPWRPLGAAVDFSTGTFAAARQLFGTDGNAAIVLNSGEVVGEDRWFVNVGQGTSAIELPDNQLPAVGDLVSFGTGTVGTTEEYEVVARNEDGNTSLRFAGDYPTEVELLDDDKLINPVNIFNIGQRIDFGQVDRLVFAPEDFVLNTEAQDIGHAHISSTAPNELVVIAPTSATLNAVNIVLRRNGGTALGDVVLAIEDDTGVHTHSDGSTLMHITDQSGRAVLDIQGLVTALDNKVDGNVNITNYVTNTTFGEQVLRFDRRVVFYDAIPAEDEIPIENGSLLWDESAEGGDGELYMNISGATITVSNNNNGMTTVADYDLAAGITAGHWFEIGGGVGVTGTARTTEGYTTELATITIGEDEEAQTFNILNANKNTILDNLDGVDTITYPIPAATADAGNDIYVVDLDNYESVGGSGTLEDNEWLYRPTVTSGDAAAAAPASWDVLDTSDLDASDISTNTQRYIIGVRGDGPDGDTQVAGLVAQVNADVSFQSNNGQATNLNTDLSTVTPELLYISDQGTENAAVLRVWISASNTNFNVWIIVDEVVSSVGVPPALTGGIRISNAFTSNTAENIVDPSFVGNLDITGTILGDNTIGGNLTVTGSTTFSDGALIQVWPGGADPEFTVVQGEYWETKNRIYRRAGGNIDVTPANYADITPLDTGTSSDWLNVTREPIVANGPGLGLVTSEAVDGQVTYTLSSDTVLNRAEVTVPTVQDQILRTGEVNSIVDFLGSGIAGAAGITLDYDADENPLPGSISLVDNVGDATTNWTEVNRIRVHSSDVASMTFFNTFTETGRNVLITYRNADSTIDTTNWALLRTTSTVTTITNGLQLSIATIVTGEYGGSVQNETTHIYRRNGAFLPDNVLAYAEAVPGSATDFNLLGLIVFDLEQTGITTITEVVGGHSNTNTQIDTTGIPGGDSATFQHQSPTSMAYLALQFNSVFDQVGGVTADNSASIVNGVVGDFTYIQYTSTWDGVAGVVFVDRVRTTAGPNAADEADERVGATLTRRYMGTGTVTQFIFDPGTANTSTVVPQV